MKYISVGLDDIGISTKMPIVSVCVEPDIPYDDVKSFNESVGTGARVGERGKMLEIYFYRF